MKDYRKYLNPQTIARLKSIEMKARLVVEGFLTGLHRSPYHGFSVEFTEHRQYQLGDEIKHIDWKVYARTDKYFIKQFEEETNLRCTIAVDKSASMEYASKGNLSKFEYSIYLAAAISYLMIKQRDSVGLALYDTNLRQYLPPRSKSSYISEILRLLDATKPSDMTGTSMALNELAERISRRGLVVIISDLLEDEELIIRALKHFRHRKHEVIVFHVLDPKEITFDLGYNANFIDMETGEEILTQPGQIKRVYNQAVDNFIKRIKKECYNHKIDYNLINTSEPFDKALREFLSKRSKL